jgi:hypothetical protein
MMIDQLHYVHSSPPGGAGVVLECFPSFAKKYWRIQLIFKKQNYSKEIEIFFEKLDAEQ